MTIHQPLPCPSSSAQSINHYSSSPLYPGRLLVLALTTAVVRTVTVVRVDVTTGAGAGGVLMSVSLLWMGGSTVVAPPGVGVPVPTVRVTVSTTVSVITAQTVGVEGVVPGRPGVTEVPGTVGGVAGAVVSGELGVGVAVGGTSVGGTSVAGVLSLPGGVPGLPGVVPVVSGLPGVGVTVDGGVWTMVVVSLPEEGVSGPPGMLGVGIVVGGTSTVTVVPLLP